MKSGNRYAICFAIVLAALTLTCTNVQAAVSSFNQAINMAGKQRMLTQRIVKNYILIGMDVDRDNAKEQLMLDIAAFEQQLEDLFQFSKSSEAKSKLQKVKALWAPFRSLAMKKPTREGATRLLKLDDELLSKTDSVVIQLQSESGTKSAKIVNVSGRQRMLTQRIAKYYLSNAWEVRREDDTSHMELAVQDFKNAMQELKAYEKNSGAVTKMLNLVDANWAMFERNYSENNGEYIPLLVSISSNTILTTMDKVTDIYASQDGNK